MLIFLSIFAPYIIIEDYVMQGMKHFIALATMFLISVCLSAKNKSSDLGIPNGRPIVIVADWNEPPFFFIDKNGTPKGYCLDLLTTALQKLEVKYVVKVESWDKSLVDLESGKADITCSFDTSNRRGKLFFGENIKQLPFYIVCRKNNSDIHSIEDLAGKKVIVRKGSIINTILKNKKIQCNIINDTTISNKLVRLNKGEYDACFANKLTLEYYIKNLKLDNLECRPVRLIQQEDRIVGNNENLVLTISDMLFKMSVDGTYTNISKKWFYVYQGVNVPTPLYAVLICLFIIAVVSVIVVRILTNKIRKANARLLEKDRRIKLALKVGGIRITEYNRKTNKCTVLEGDYSEKSVMTVDYIISHVHPDDKEQFSRLMENVQRGLVPSDPQIFRFNIAIRNQWRYIQIYLTNVRDVAGNIVRTIATHTDITDRVLASMALKVEKEKAQKADYLKSEFLANMSHEIRTPLNAIIGFSDVISQKIVSEKDVEECSALIHKNSDMLLNLINDILDLSRIESGELDIENNEFDLTDIIRGLYLSIKSTHSDDSKVDFRMSLPYSICLVNTDRRRVLQILTNFVTNAFKYTEEGHILIGYEKEDNGIRLYVEDTGKGLPEDSKDSVFSRFEKLGSHKQGTGLGLSICKAIVEHMNGRIGVDSEKGKGSTFWAWIPTDVVTPNNAN